MFNLKNIVVKGSVVLAPMAGITSFGYRKYLNSFGVGLCYTEMVSDMGLIYGNKETFTYIDFPKTDIPTGVQLFGENPENLAKALLICEKFNPNIDFYDINMGCPVPKVTKTGAGSALLKDPKKCGDIIRALKAVSDKPITAKIRIGVDKSHINFMEVIEELEKAGVDLIAIHPRTAKEMYGGEPHYDLVKDLRSKMSVPLVISGNIFTVEDAKKALEITGADAVMVARGAIGNPLLITNINNALTDKDYVESSLEKQIDYCKQLAISIIEEKGEDVAMRIYRGISTHFFASYPDSKKVKNRLSTELVKYQDLEQILNEYLQKMKENNF